MHEEERKKAAECVYNALKKGGIYISFENIIPEDEEIKKFELLRWGRLARESYIDGIWNKSSVEEWLTEIQLPII